MYQVKNSMGLQNQMKQIDFDDIIINRNFDLICVGQCLTRLIKKN